MNRRSFLAASGATLGASGVVRLARGASIEDPYTEEWTASPNHTNTSRGANDINWIVIHVTAGSYSGAVSWLQNPESDVSAHYVIRNSDGHTTQMVRHEDIAWHAGGQNYNDYSIGIEHEGQVDQTDFTEALYRKSANIVSYLCDKYDIPKRHPSGVAPCDATSGEGGIIGHHQVPEANCGPNGHTDPGSTWDWDHYMDLVGGVSFSDDDIEDNGDNGDERSYSWKTYSKGDESKAVYAIQCLLKHHGYDLRHQTGTFDERLKQTVKKFQKDNGLSSDGVVDADTWGKLAVPVSGPDVDIPSPDDILSFLWDLLTGGFEVDTDEPNIYWAVVAVQHLLVGLNYKLKIYGIDGSYNNETEATIKHFQRRAKIGVTGEVDTSTWQALIARKGSDEPIVVEFKDEGEKGSGDRGGESDDQKPGFGGSSNATYTYPTTGTITSPYGSRSGGFHGALDIGNSIGTPIYAARAGTVKTMPMSTHNDGCGNYIVIDHGDGYSTLYCHMSGFSVSDGAFVAQNQQIGEMGSTGNSTGPHLHFEVNKNGSSVRLPGTDGAHVNAHAKLPNVG